MSRSVKYPKTLSDMMDVIESKLLRVNFEKTKARKLAEDIIFEVANYYGGRAFYLPIGRAMKTQLKHRRIFVDWKADMSIDDLAKKYETSFQNIYIILAKQRELRRKEAGGSNNNNINTHE